MPTTPPLGADVGFCFFLGFPVASEPQVHLRPPTEVTEPLLTIGGLEGGGLLPGGAFSFPASPSLGFSMPKTRRMNLPTAHEPLK